MKKIILVWISLCFAIIAGNSGQVFGLAVNSGKKEIYKRMRQEVVNKSKISVKIKLYNSNNEKVISEENIDIPLEKLEDINSFKIFIFKNFNKTITNKHKIKNFIINGRQLTKNNLYQTMSSIKSNKKTLFIVYDLKPKIIPSRKSNNIVIIKSDNSREKIDYVSGMTAGDLRKKVKYNNGLYKIVCNGKELKNNDKIDIGNNHLHLCLININENINTIIKSIKKLSKKYANKLNNVSLPKEQNRISSLWSTATKAESYIKKNILPKLEDIYSNNNDFNTYYETLLDMFKTNYANKLGPLIEEVLILMCRNSNVLEIKPEVSIKLDIFDLEEIKKCINNQKKKQLFTFVKLFIWTPIETTITKRIDEIIKAFKNTNHQNNFLSFYKSFFEWYISTKNETIKENVEKVLNILSKNKDKWNMTNKNKKYLSYSREQELNLLDDWLVSAKQEIDDFDPNNCGISNDEKDFSRNWTLKLLTGGNITYSFSSEATILDLKKYIRYSIYKENKPDELRIILVGKERHDHVILWNLNTNVKGHLLLRLGGSSDMKTKDEKINKTLKKFIVLSKAIGVKLKEMNDITISNKIVYKYLISMLSLSEKERQIVFEQVNALHKLKLEDLNNVGSDKNKILKQVKKDYIELLYTLTTNIQKNKQNISLDNFFNDIKSNKIMQTAIKKAEVLLSA